MIVLYRAGPTERWKGICEYDTETRMFVHHPKWPDRASGLPRPTLTPLDQLISSRIWELAPNPELQLPEWM